jgi:hypothetical protein
MDCFGRALSPFGIVHVTDTDRRRLLSLFAVETVCPESEQPKTVRATGAVSATSGACPGSHFERSRLYLA